MRASGTVADSRPRGNGVNQMCFFSALKSKPNPHSRNAHKPPIALPRAFCPHKQTQGATKDATKGAYTLISCSALQHLVAPYSTSLAKSAKRERSPRASVICPLCGQPLNLSTTAVKPEEPSVK